MGKANDQIKESKAGLLANILFSLIFIGLGVTMLLVDTSIISTIIYSFLVLAIGLLLIAFGTYFMIRYIVTKQFEKLTNYSFTTGVILIIVGAVLLFMAAQLSIFIDAIVCLIGIVLGAVMLQDAFGLFHIERSAWLASVVFAAITIGVSIYFLMTNQKFFDGNVYSCTYLIAVGSLSLISLIMMAISLQSHKKVKEKNISRNMDEAPSSQVAAEESIFEEEAAGAEEPQFEE